VGFDRLVWGDVSLDVLYVWYGRPDLPAYTTGRDLPPAPAETARDDRIPSSTPRGRHVLGAQHMEHAIGAPKWG